MTVFTSNKPQEGAARYHNAADWLRALGEIPLERILLDPPPGMATEEDLIRKIDGGEKQLCELVDATLVEKAMGWYESVLAFLLGRKLLDFVIPRRLGAVSGADGPLRLRLGLVRIPDVAFISREQLRRHQGVHEPIPSLIPELVVEVLSPGNRPREMRRKLEDYFAAGVALVWFIDPASRSAEVYRGVDQLRRIEPNGLLSGEDVLSGFELSLGELFAETDRMVEGES